MLASLKVKTKREEHRLDAAGAFREATERTLARDVFAADCAGDGVRAGFVGYRAVADASLRGAADWPGDFDRAFGAHVWKRTQEISELRGLVQGIEQRDSMPPDEKQMNQLFDMISRSQQGYRDLIDSFDDILIAVTLEGEIRAVNRSFADLMATPYQEIIGKPLVEFVQESSGDGRVLAKNAMPRFLERRTWSGVVHVHLKNQAGVFYFDCVANAMLRDGKVHGVTILARDVSALRKNEARFTELFETLQEGIYIINPAGDILDVNPALVRMLGYESKEDLVSHRVPDIFQDRSERKSIRNEVDRQPILQGREITLTRKDGTPLICLNTAAAVRDSAGTVIRYQGALMDVTASRVMERRLHQQQEFARRLIDSFPDLIFVLDNAANYTFVSPRVVEVLGYEPEEVMELELGIAYEFGRSRRVARDVSTNSCRP